MEKSGHTPSGEELKAIFAKARTYQKQKMRTFVFETKMMGRKNIARTVAVSEGINLYEFAEIIVGVYRFDFDHCFGFFSNVTSEGSYLDSDKSFELFADLAEEGEDIEPVESLPVKNTYINEVWGKIGDQMMFVFDYGDDWRFSVTLVAEGNKIAPSLPIVLKSIGKAPKQYA